jgi:AP-2 complex subunit alpha
MKLPPEAPLMAPAEWSSRLSALLLAPFSPGSQLAVMGLITAVLERSTEGFEALQPLIVRDLVSTASGRGMRSDYLYYGIPCPWLQCKCAPAAE